MGDLIRIQDVTGLLPYNRQEYIEFLDDDFNGQTKWNAVSLQSDELDFHSKIAILNLALQKIVSIVDDGSYWVVNHDNNDLEWFPNNNQGLNSLREVFKRNQIQNSDKGALVLRTEQLLSLSEDLISYSYLLGYKNLDISHQKVQFVIKTTSHLTLDLLSRDVSVLSDIVKNNFLNTFRVKEYRGTSLDLSSPV